MVHCRYTIEAYVLRVDHEVHSVEKKGDVWYLNIIYSLKDTFTDNTIESKYWHLTLKKPIIK